LYVSIKNKETKDIIRLLIDQISWTRRLRRPMSRLRIACDEVLGTLTRSFIGPLETFDLNDCSVDDMFVLPAVRLLPPAKEVFGICYFLWVRYISSVSHTGSVLYS